MPLKLFGIIQVFLNNSWRVGIGVLFKMIKINCFAEITDAANDDLCNSGYFDTDLSIRSSPASCDVSRIGLPGVADIARRGGAGKAVFRRGV